VPVIGTEAADAATVWTIHRFVDVANKKFDLRVNKAVLVGDYLITVAHGFGGRSRTQVRMMSDRGPLVGVRLDEFSVAGDPDMTVTLKQPDPLELHEKLTCAPLSKLRDEGARSTLAGPDEMRVHPVFADPYSDVAVLADHPDAPGTLATIRRDRAPLRIRRTPIVDGEIVHVRGERGWGRAIAAAWPGPSAKLAVADDVLVNGDCGGPVLAEDGSLIGVCGVALVNDMPGAFARGLLAQLHLVLPVWLVNQQEQRPPAPAPLTRQQRRQAERTAAKQA
jgi:hypothetical protein